MIPIYWNLENGSKDFDFHLSENAFSKFSEQCSFTQVLYLYVVCVYNPNISFKKLLDKTKNFYEQ